MADACNRAFSLTGEYRWRNLALRAGTWLLGANDSRTVMYDEENGGTYDGLTATGVNLNQGAESTLAGLGILQIAASVRNGRPTSRSRGSSTTNSVNTVSNRSTACP